MKKILILITIVSTVLIFGFSKEVKANQLQPDTNTAIYIEMEFTEYEVFNNGIDVIFQLVVLNPLTNFSGSSTTDLLMYMTQQLETAIWVLPLPHNYYIEIQTPNGAERISTFVDILIINNHNDTLKGYRSAGVLDFDITLNDIVGMGGTEIKARRLTSTGMSEYQQIWNEGFSYGFSQGNDYGYNIGYNEGNSDGYVFGYNEGYGEGMLSTNNEAYEQGIKDAQLTALGSFDKWFVPAIIVVIILGGFVTIIQKRKSGDT